MKKSSFVLLLAGIALVIWIVNWQPTDAPRHEKHLVKEKAATKVAEGESTSVLSSEIMPGAGPNGPAPELSANTAAAAGPLETSREKMTRLLSATHSRETALAYLDALLDQHSVSRVAAADIPVIEILNEEALPPVQREPLTAEEQANGWVRVVYRVEGRVVAMKAQALPVDFIPEKVRAYLTEDDLRHFQAAQFASNVERGAAHLRNRVRPSPSR